MNYVIIRTCARDDYLSLLCYESFRNAGIDAKYVFVAEEWKAFKNEAYTWIHKPEIEINFRKPCDNYGGQLGAKAMISFLRDVLPSEIEDDDIIIVSDSDVVVKENFIDLLEDDFQHAGTAGAADTPDRAKNRPEGDFLHISGQMQIFSGMCMKSILDMVKNESIIDAIVEEMLELELNIADDTFMSYVTDVMRQKKQLMLLGDKWIHQKFYEHVGRTDWQELINEIKEQTILSTQ